MSTSTSLFSSGNPAPESIVFIQHNIFFCLDEEQKLCGFNILGQKTKQRHELKVALGAHHLINTQWNGQKNLLYGVYLIEIPVGHFSTALG